MIGAYLALLAGVLVGVGGQLLLKKGAGVPGGIVQQLLAPPTIVGLALYGAAAFLYIIALRRLPLSIAFPSVSLSYAVVALLGHWLWGEPFGLPQAAGIALVIGGVVLLNQT